jgi:glycosyltransferase involved in cell wall biosynthesis
VRNFFVQSQKILEPESWVIPVYLSSENGWKYSIADEWSIYNLNRLGITVVDSNEIDFHPGDSLVICDISSNLIDAYAEGLFNFLLLKRVKISGFIYDALPITQPQYFPTAVESVFHSWFQTMLQICQVVLTSSYSTKSEIESLLANVEGPFSEDQLRVEVDRYPSAIDCHEDCRSNYPPSESFKRKLNTGVCGLQFLMVGTIEPRKGHLEVLRIFEKLWNEGCKCTLSIVGKEGWVGVEILSYIEALMEKHSAITWFSEAKDNDLCHLYNSADYLIAASFAEGYGLPLVEAQKHGLAVIARDIKVFREIADASTIFMDFTQLESGAKLLKDIMETPTPEVNFSTSYPGWDRYCRSVLGKITFK